MKYPKAFAVITIGTLILCYMGNAELQKGSTIIACVAVAGIIYRVYSKIRYTNECMRIHRKNLKKVEEEKNSKEWKWF